MQRRVIPTLLFLLITTSMLQAQTPRTISYQGVLADDAGTFVEDGSYTIRVSLHDALSGGTEIFTETHQSVVIRGVFNVIIGSVTPLPASLRFDRAYFLEVSVDGTTLAPRTPLTAVPYAFHASTADVADGLSPNATGVVRSVNGGSGALTLAGAGGTTITRSGETITIMSTGTGGTGIQGVQNSDGSLAITAPAGPVAGLSVAPGGISTAKLADNAVTTAKLDNDAVTGAKLADLAVTTPKLADLAVTTPKLADLAVTTSKLADLAVTTPKLADLAVTTGKLADNAVTTVKLVDNAVTGTKLADNTVTAAKLADNAVTTAKLADNAVTSAKLADNAVTAAKLADNAVTSAKLADNAVTTAKLNNDAVNSSKILDGSIGGDDVSSAAELNIAKLTTSGTASIGTQASTARLTVQGAGATSATAGLNVTNSAGTSLLYVRNDGNIGIGTTTPTAGLEIANTGGLYISGGHIVLSKGTVSGGQDVTIPSNKTIVEVTDDGASGPNRITLPSTAAEGQVLFLIVTDANGAQSTGYDRDHLYMFVWVGRWRRVY